MFITFTFKDGSWDFLTNQKERDVSILSLVGWVQQTTPVTSNQNVSSDLNVKCYKYCLLYARLYMSPCRCLLTIILDISMFTSSRNKCTQSTFTRRVCKDSVRDSVLTSCLCVERCMRMHSIVYTMQLTGLVGSCSFRFSIFRCFLPNLQF